MYTFLFIACHLAFCLAAPQVPATVYGPPPIFTGQQLLSAPAPAPVVPGQQLLSAPAPAPVVPVPASAPLPVPAPAPVPHLTYSVPAPLASGGELLSAPAPGGAAEEIVLPQNTRLEIRDNQGQYSHGFSDNKGTQVSEQGSLITTNGGWEYVIAKKGSYSYISPEGKKVSVSYVADHNGYRILDQNVE